MHDWDTKINNLDKIFDSDWPLKARQEVLKIRDSDSILEYVIKILNTLRNQEDVEMPLSPRSGKDLILAAKAWAYIDNFEYVLPDHIQLSAPSVLGHRLYSLGHINTGHERIKNVLRGIDVP